jgi:tRNA 2-thiouridine synthesizing protein A
VTNAPSSNRLDQEIAESLRVDASLDCKGLLCPLPVYRASQAMGKLSVGHVLRVECTDPGSIPDFSAFARQQGHTLLSAEEQEGVQVFHLRKEHR